MTAGGGGPVALVTGAGGGIGLAVVTRLRLDGFRMAAATGLDRDAVRATTCPPSWACRSGVRKAL